MKGLSECKASESNIRRIRVKDIVKEVEDYLKTYSSAGMDISWRETQYLLKARQKIPPPFGASSGNPGSPNVNRVDTMPTTTDPINTTTTTNVSQSVVDENLPQLLDSRGGSHVTNVPAFDKEDFTSWKVRFLVFLDGLEPYLLKTLEDGPFVPMSSLSTSENPLPKRQNQWSNAESRLANQDKRLKSIIISCLPNDVMKSVIKCKTVKEMWNDLILAHEGPSDIRDTKIAALRLKFNAFKSLEGEKVNGTFTRLKCLLNDLKNNSVTIPQAEVNATFVSDSDVKKDQRTCNKFMVNLNVEYHERALLENEKRFYKRSGRDYKGKYKGLKIEMAVLTKRIDDLTKGKSKKGKNEKGMSEKGLIVESFNWDEESISLEDKRTTKIRAFMTITEDEPSIGKADARSGQWVDITMKKVHKLLSMTDGDERKHVLDYTHVDLHYVEGQRKNLLNKFNLLKQELSLHKSELCNLKTTVSINCSLQYEVIWVNLENESLKDEISDLKKEPLPLLPVLIGADSTGTSHSIISLADLTSNMVELTLDTSVSKGDNQTSDKVSTFLGLKRQIKIPSGTSPSITQSSSSKSTKRKTWFGPYKHCGLRNHLSDDCYSKPKCSTCGSTDHLTKEHIEQGVVKKTLIKLKARSSVNPSAKKAPMILKPFKECKYCGFNNYHSENYEYYLRCKDYLKRSVWYLDSVCSRHMTWVKQNLHRYSKESGPKVVFGDDSSACEKRKHHRASFKTKRSFSISKCLHLLHMDLFRPVKPQTISHNKYTLVIVDEYSRKIENLNEVKVKELRSDNGTEFRNHNLEEFCDEKGIS
ncbi:retrovirus-related pol polyprotein from transposon TNT 1-94 [Tanacetum coccineum]